MDTHTRMQIQNRVISILDSLRPYLQADEGDIKLVEITEDYVVKVELLGACKECPYRQQTIAGIEQAIIKEVPEITGIQVI